MRKVNHIFENLYDLVTSTCSIELSESLLGVSFDNGDIDNSAESQLFAIKLIHINELNN